jgi:hypothetical protein
MAEVAGIEPTGRGSPVPLVLKTRRATRPCSPPLEIMADVPARTLVAPPIQCRDQPAEEVIVKKLLLLLVLVALGAAVARKVRSA